MKVTSSMAKDMGKASAPTPMDPTTTENGRWAFIMAKESLDSTLGTPTKEIGKKGRDMDKEY